jgi:hypothetical protein
MQAFLHRLPKRLLAPITRDNAIRVFNLPPDIGK